MDAIRPNAVTTRRQVTPCSGPDWGGGKLWGARGDGWVGGSGRGEADSFHIETITMWLTHAVLGTVLAAGEGSGAQVGTVIIIAHA